MKSPCVAPCLARFGLLLQTATVGCAVSADGDYAFDPLAEAPSADRGGAEALDPTGQSKQALYALAPSIWPDADIPVCWEQPGHDTEKAWVREAVSVTWEAEGNVELTGWDNCGAGTHEGIRIASADVRPHTRGLGSELDNLPGGMVLNFWFEAVAGFPACAGDDFEACIRIIAVHEFGHALGFAHEQDRPDTTQRCIDALEPEDFEAEDGDTTIGPWDGDSVMNYCALVWNNGGELTGTDIEGLQRFYGSRRPIAARATGPGRLDYALQSVEGNLQSVWSADGIGASTTHGQPVASAPSLVSSASGRLDLFVRGADGTLQTITWNGSIWTSDGFVPLDTRQIVGRPVAVSRSPDQMDVLYRGADQRWYLKSWNGSWSSALVIGASFVGTPAMIARGPEELDLVGRVRDGTLAMISYAYGIWYSRPLGNERFLGNPSAVSPSGGRVDVFARGLDGSLYSNTWNGSAWSGYARLGTNAFLGDPEAVSRGPNLIDVFVRGTGSGLWMKSWNGSQWSSYSLVASNPIVASPTVATADTNQLSVFVRRANSGLYRKTWDGVAWSPYTNLGQQLR